VLALCTASLVVEEPWSEDELLAEELAAQDYQQAHEAWLEVLASLPAAVEDAVEAEDEARMPRWPCGPFGCRRRPCGPFGCRPRPWNLPAAYSSDDNEAAAVPSEQKESLSEQVEDAAEAEEEARMPRRRPCGRPFGCRPRPWNLPAAYSSDDNEAAAVPSDQKEFLSEQVEDAAEAEEARYRRRPCRRPFGCRPRPWNLPAAYRELSGDAEYEEEGRLLGWYLNKKIYNLRRAQFYKRAQLARLTARRLLP
jgi:hypothetical protein